MRILVLHSRYLSGPVSGENRCVEDEVALLRKAGHDVRVWTPEPRRLRGLKLMQSGARTIWSPEAVRRVRRLIDDKQPDVIHFHNLVPMLSPAVLRAADAEGVPVVMTLHNYRLLCLPATFLRNGRTCELCLGRVPWRGVAFRCYRGSALGSAAIASALTLHRAIGTFDRISLLLAVSQFVKKKHVEAGVSASRIRLKPYFRWPTQRRERPGDYFLFLGRLSPEKGVMMLVRAWNERWGRLVVVGDGPQASTLGQMAQPTVEVRGPVQPDEIPSLLAGARAVLVPSLSYEGAPLVVLEAYAAGVPVLASRIGALEEIVGDGESGLLITPGSIQAWADGIERLADDSESRRLGQGAYELWEKHYSPEPGLRNLESAYQQALAKHDGF